VKYSEILKANRLLENKDSSTYKITILSNIMVHQAKDLCEYSLRVDNVNAFVQLGDYDNIVQDSLKFKELNAVVIFWEMYNFIDGLQYKSELLSQKGVNDLIIKIKIEIDIVFNNFNDISLLIINKFSNLIFNQYELSKNKSDFIIDELNKYLTSKNQINLQIIDIDKVIAKASIKRSVDLRYFYSSKTLYSIEFYREYFAHIKPLFLLANGKIKKALIFDCDNTLWKGVLGEDGFDNIKMFQEVQYLAKILSKSGVIIGLCSKNNAKDIDEVIQNHKNMILKSKDIVIKKVNWEDKVSNIKAIAKELNIGLDSLVFVDDSDFEVNLIKEELPMVKVLQVPKKECEYNLLIRNAMNLFYNPSQTKEDLVKVTMYKTQVQRVNQEQKIGNIEEYLKSLKLEITTYIDDINSVARISQMTQKTNQFNLTTKRYAHKDIEVFINNDNYTVLAIGVNDKFGDNGIVGLAILEYNNNIAYIDTLLMSCRVLGRNIEYRFMDIINDIVISKGFEKLSSNYIKTLKNEQVSDLYDRYGFKILEKDEESTSYTMLVKRYKGKKLEYIRIKNGK
jgi:FkbH-like protein